MLKYHNNNNHIHLHTFKKNFSNPHEWVEDRDALEGWETCHCIIEMMTVTSELATILHKPLPVWPVIIGSLPAHSSWTVALDAKDLPSQLPYWKFSITQVWAKVLSGSKYLRQVPFQVTTPTCRPGMHTCLHTLQEGFPLLLHVCDLTVVVWIMMCTLFIRNYLLPDIENDQELREFLVGFGGGVVDCEKLVENVKEGL